MFTRRYRSIFAFCCVTCAISLTFATSGGDLANKMHVVALTADSRSVAVNATIVMRCSVANMDPTRFARYLKIDRNNHDVVLTTNSVKENNIKTLDRYSIRGPEKNDWNGYDFILNIAEAQVADSGTYVCTIPQLNSSAQVEISVINDPTSITLYIDDRLITDQEKNIIFDDVTEHNVTCSASGGYPQPVLSLSLGTMTLNSTTLSRCRVEENSLFSSFLNHVACMSTTSASGLVIDYATSGSSLTCSAQSPSSLSVPLTMSVVVVFRGGLPEITCNDTSVTVKVHSNDVRILCQVSAYPPLTDAFIQWSDKELLRPNEGKNDTKFVSDGYRTAYLHPQQGGNRSQLEMVFSHVHPHMFRNYHFVAVNGFGASGYFVTLKREPEIQTVKVKSKNASNGTTCHRSDIVLVLFALLSTLLSLVISRRIQRL